MNGDTNLQDELDEYEERLGEIAEVLLDDQLTSDEKLEAIEAIVFPGDE